MEIERKFLINTLPDGLNRYPSDTIRQAYISTDPVIRVRQKSNDYILTIKSQGLLAREETELPLSEESFSHLLKKRTGFRLRKFVTGFRILTVILLNWTFSREHMKDLSWQK